ncbi:hypothetical protein Mpet_1558 [Methanolacinia petrolearia DSM 11571]|uniref:Uncharacterized protein n=1 Tax=Methanolacinia petrolearia (strain DSM 11571 / OCM 486 / SEBR 4847) TaxID=679926 RepID=E1RGM0_METP4|nr:hypothetical protein [Methanolacinia petrolearia]ADN36315.1 hypothetical protein Mpet_1558 [Methanolacinia petrolearia DSM 11571]
MKTKTQHILTACILAAVLIVMVAFAVSGIEDNKIPPDPAEKISESTDSQNNPTPNTTRENTTFIDIHHADGGRIILYPEDPEFSAIETECYEQIRCINAQMKTGFSGAELDAMKNNGTYVAINFSAPTTFETSYIVDGSPKTITIDEAIFFLYSEYELMIITPMQNAAGVWGTSRDRGELKKLVDPIFQKL